MATNQSRATEAAVVFRDVVKVYHPGVRALALLRWRREATATA